MKKLKHCLNEAFLELLRKYVNFLRIFVAVNTFNEKDELHSSITFFYMQLLTVGSSFKFCFQSQDLFSLTYRFVLRAS